LRRNFEDILFSAGKRMSQWLIIHGRAPGNDLAAPASDAARPAGSQQPHPGPWAAERFGAWALRSLVAWARRKAPGSAEKAGAARLRAASAPQSGQGAGSANSATGRTASNGPHDAQL
jgi:hypothetical protein